MNINNLLEKYWNAETSLQEEAELRAYFSSNDVAPEHKQYADLFAFFTINRLQSTDLDVEEVLTNLSDIESIIERYWNAETSLEEEAQLKAYFNGDSIAPDHLKYKDLFTFYKVNESLSTDIDLGSESRQSDDIDKLLEKYWNAETSLEEEQILKHYFGTSHVEERHESYGTLFNMFSDKSLMTTDLNIGNTIENKDLQIGNRAIGTSKMPKAASSKVFSLQRWASSVAAIFVIGFAAITIMNQETQLQYKGQTTILDEEAEAQEAYEITKEALAFLSKSMNKGSKTVVKSVSKAEKVSIFK